MSLVIGKGRKSVSSSCVHYVLRIHCPVEIMTNWEKVLIYSNFLKFICCAHRREEYCCVQMPQNNTREGSSFAVFLLVSLYGFPWIYQAVDRRQDLIYLVTIKGLAPFQKNMPNLATFAQT